MGKLKGLVALMGVGAIGMAAVKISGTPAPDAPPAVHSSTAPAAAAVDACINRGIAYFQAVGSYPTLTDGRNAVDASRERCRIAPDSYRM